MTKYTVFELQKIAKFSIRFVEIHFVLFIVSCCISISIGNGLKISNLPQNPIPDKLLKLPTLSCMYSPPSPEWYKCMREFRYQMEAYRKKISAVRQDFLNNKKMNSINSKDQNSPQKERDESGVSDLKSSVTLNGYTITAQGPKVKTNSMVGDIIVEMELGTSDQIELTKNGKERTWEVFTNGTRTSWITLSPPDEVDIRMVQHQVENRKLLITGPSGGGGGIMR